MSFVIGCCIRKGCIAMRMGSLSTDKDHIQFLYQIPALKRDKDAFVWFYRAITSGMFNVRQVGCKDSWVIEKGGKQAGIFSKEDLKLENDFVEKCMDLEGHDYYMSGQCDKREVTLGINLEDSCVYLVRKTKDTGFHEDLEEKLGLNAAMD